MNLYLFNYKVFSHAKNKKSDLVILRIQICIPLKFYINVLKPVQYNHHSQVE